MQDIQSKLDIEFLIRQFYLKLLEIDGMKEVFKDINFENHLPQIVSFWAFVLFDESGYKTNVFEKHLHLPIQTYQFDVWLTCFLETTNNLFIGEKAELAKQRATVLTQTFKSKWQNIKNI